MTSERNNITKKRRQHEESKEFLPPTTRLVLSNKNILQWHVWKELHVGAATKCATPTKTSSLLSFSLLSSLYFCCRVASKIHVNFLTISVAILTIFPLYVWNYKEITTTEVLSHPYDTWRMDFWGTFVITKPNGIMAEELCWTACWKVFYGFQTFPEIICTKKFHWCQNVEIFHVPKSLESMHFGSVLNVKR